MHPPDVFVDRAEVTRAHGLPGAGMRGRPHARAVDQIPQRPMVPADADQMGLVEVIPPLVPTERAVEPGLVGRGMGLATLRGRRPLARVDAFCTHDDPARRVGRDRPPQVLNADPVGRGLERLSATGTMPMVTAGAGRAARLCGVAQPDGHVATTATRGEGDARPSAGPAVPCRITPGESQATRPDRTPGVCSRRGGERAGPIGGTAEEGSAADPPRKPPVWSASAPRLAPHGVAPGASLDRAAAALVTADQRRARREPVGLSRGPATDAAGERVIQAAGAPQAWHDGGVWAPTQPPPPRPRASATAWARGGTREGTASRAGVVPSSAQDTRRPKRRDRAFQAAAPTGQAARRVAEPQGSGGRAAAAAAATQLRARPTAAHRVDVPVAARPPSGPGRPSPRTPRAVNALRHGRQPVRTAQADRRATTREAAGGCVRLTPGPQAGAGAHRAGDVRQAAQAPPGVAPPVGVRTAPVLGPRLCLQKPARIAA
jgi:hypothetical protein